eukprot:61044-Amphidinium_carterae.1
MALSGLANLGELDGNQKGVPNAPGTDMPLGQAYHSRRHGNGTERVSVCVCVLPYLTSRWD